MRKATSRAKPVFEDPSRVNLRKAARATLVVTALFALMVEGGETQVALFAGFGSFAALVFADFGGPLGARLRAYGGLLVGGALLVALGTELADTTVAAVVAMVIVGFGVTFAGALGGYFAAGGTAVILAFVLAVMSPGVDAGIAARELGWIFGVSVAGVAAVTLWPVHQSDRVRAAIVAALREAARFLEGPDAARDLEPVRTAIATLGSRTGVVYRPAGNIGRERALVAIVIEMRRLSPSLEQMATADSSPTADELPAYGALASQVASTFLASAEVLSGEVDGPPDIEALTRARDAHARALEAWADGVLEHDDAAGVVDRFAASFPLRRLSLMATELAGHAATVARPHVPAASRLREWWVQARLTLRAHLDPRSVRFRNAARAGIGLALAVLVAKTASVEHAFWVVLGSLAVLRSNALGTGATAVQALVGALLGFGVASALMVTVGADAAALWLALPVVVFLAAYTPGAVNFVVGQASFTVFVVVLFNLLEPQGWRTGLVRVQDVAIGAAISVVVGALLWPRGARGVARRAFAQLLRAGNEYLGRAVATLSGGSEQRVHEAAARERDARERAVAALEDLALEHGGGQVDRTTWLSSLAETTRVRLAAGGITRAVSVHALTTGCDAARASVDALARSVADRVEREAIRIERGGPADGGVGPPTALPVPATLEACLAAHRQDGLDAAIGLVWVYEWLALAGERPR